MGVRIGGIASLDRTGQKEVYFRLASNLAGQYMADGQHAHELQLVLTLLLALQPGAHFLHMRAEVPPNFLRKRGTVVVCLNELS